MPPATQSRCHYNLGFLLTEHGRHDEAIEPLRKALEIRIGLLGNDHPKTIPARAMLSLALRHEQRFDEAIEVLEEASRVASGNGRSAAGERIRIGREFGRVYLARDQPGDLDRAEETLDGVLRELVSLGPGNLRQFTPIVHALMTCIERRDGRSAAMQAAMALGERFSAGSPEMAAAIRIEAIRRFATASMGEWPEGPPIEAVRADLATIAGAVGVEGHQSLHGELVLAQLLASCGEATDRQEGLARARSLRDRTERIGVAVKSVREAAESLLKP